MTYMPYVVQKSNSFIPQFLKLHAETKYEAAIELQKN